MNSNGGHELQLLRGKRRQKKGGGEG